MMGRKRNGWLEFRLCPHHQSHGFLVYGKGLAYPEAILSLERLGEVLDVAIKCRLTDKEEAKGVIENAKKAEIPKHRKISGFAEAMSLGGCVGSALKQWNCYKLPIHEGLVKYAIEKYGKDVMIFTFHFVSAYCRKTDKSVQRVYRK
ncbi:MAG TPA: hypothetical protein VJJ22_01260 [Candidatus Paceibacterota bacterium]